MNTEVASPCIKVCVVDDRGICRGCLRTLEEIAAWSRLGDAERREVLVRIAARRTAVAPPP